MDKKKFDSSMPIAPHLQYVEGLLGMMREREDGSSLTLDEARKILLEDINRVQGFEHIPYLEAAYKKLKEDQNKPK